MKPLKTIVLFLALLLLFSCGRNGHLSRQLDCIDSVGNSHPMLAIRMLDSLDAPVRSASKKIQARYDLLDVKLHDKAHIPATSDLEIKNAVAYYDKHGNKRQRAEAYYYAGCVYWDLKDTPRSLEACLKAKDICQESKRVDSALLLNTYSRLYLVYSSVKDYASAAKMAMEEYRLRTHHGDLDAATVQRLGIALKRSGKGDEARKHLAEAFRLVVRAGQPRREVVYPLLPHFSSYQMHDYADSCYQFILRSKALAPKTPGEYLALAEYFSEKNQLDSAILCAEKALANSRDTETKCDASRLLFLISNKKGDATAVCRYATQFVVYSDALNLGERQEQAATVNNRYLYNKNKLKEERALRRADHARYVSIMIAVVCFLLLLGVMVIVLYIRNQRLEAIQRRQRRLEGAQMRIRKLKQDIEESNRQLELLKASLEKKRRETENLAGEIERYEKEQSHSTQLLEEKVRQNAQLIQLLHQSEIAKGTDGIIAKLKKASVGQYRLEDAEWNVFMKAVDEKFPSFSFTLSDSRRNISELEMRFCYLRKAGFSGPQIRSLIGISRTTAWRWSNRYSWISREKERRGRKRME